MLLQKIIRECGFSVVLPAVVKSQYGLKSSDRLLFTISNCGAGKQDMFSSGVEVGDAGVDTTIPIELADLLEESNELFADNTIYDYRITVYSDDSAAGAGQSKFFSTCASITNDIFSNMVSR